MGIRIADDSLQNVILMIQQIGDKAKSEVLKGMRKEAEVIAEIAQMNAPVELGNLEDAIHVKEEKVGKRIAVFVEASGTIRGRNVDEYAWVMHEGFYKLGEASIRKGQTLGRVVGRKFLERAANEHLPVMIKKLQQIAVETVGR